MNLYLLLKGEKMIKKYSQKEIEKKVKRFAREMFGWEMNKPVIISSRMTRAWGKYYYKFKKKTNEIELVKFQFATRLISGGYQEEDINNCIKHELLHWYTDITEGKPCHHNRKWKDNCKRFGIKDERYCNYERVDGIRDTPNEYKWQYQCSNHDCDNKFKRHRRVPKTHVCAKCRSKLIEEKYK